jgi:hypothetical protein
VRTIVGVPDLGACEARTRANFNAFIWESLPTPGNGTLANPALHPKSAPVREATVATAQSLSAASRKMGT